MEGHTLRQNDGMSLRLTGCIHLSLHLLLDYRPGRGCRALLQFISRLIAVPLPVHSVYISIIPWWTECRRVAIARGCTDFCFAFDGVAHFVREGSRYAGFEELTRCSPFPPSSPPPLVVFLRSLPNRLQRPQPSTKKASSLTPSRKESSCQSEKPSSQTPEVDFPQHTNLPNDLYQTISAQDFFHDSNKR